MPSDIEKRLDRLEVLCEDILKSISGSHDGSTTGMRSEILLLQAKVSEVEESQARLFSKITTISGVVGALFGALVTGADKFVSFLSGNH